MLPVMVKLASRIDFVLNTKKFQPRQNSIMPLGSLKSGLLEKRAITNESVEKGILEVFVLRTSLVSTLFC